MQGYEKTIICLANSRKLSGRCIAGKEYEDSEVGEWLRPVSSRPGQEISEADRRYKNGVGAHVLDIISIQMKKPAPSGHQRENHLINDRYYWDLEGRADASLLDEVCDVATNGLWGEGHSSSHGHNDRVPEARISEMRSSLLFVRPQSLRVQVLAERADFQDYKKVVRAFFDHEGTHYRLVVTDPEIESRYCARGDGMYQIDDALVCVSLAEEAYHGHYYKLVASIITPDRIGASA